MTDERKGRASPAAQDRATHERSPQAVSAVPVGIADAGHTPGPWSMVRRVGEDTEIWAQNATDDLVALVSDGDAEFANARLIAAAPELLEALQAALAVHGGSYSWGEAAKAAITKATGAA